MILRAVPLEFHTNFDRSGAVAFPKDPALFRMVEQFSEEHLVDKPNYAHGYQKCWAAVEMDESEKPLSVQGVIGYQNTPDITLCRTLTPQAMKRLTERISSYFSDNGARGFPVLIYINPNEDERQKCPKVEESLAWWKAVPANRFQVQVR